MTLEFDLSRNIDAAAQDVQAAIARAQGNFPPICPRLLPIRKVNPAEQPIMYVSTHSDTMTLSNSISTPRH